MSHVTAGKLPITDLDCAREAVGRFPKLKWNEGAKTYAWYNRFQDDWGKNNEHKTARARGIDPSLYGKCDHSISMEGCPYEIGVTKRADGRGWSLVWDVWRGQAISEYIGQDAERFMCAYAEQYYQRYAQETGCLYTSSVDENGDTLVELLQLQT